MRSGLFNESSLSHFVAWTLLCATQEGVDEYGKDMRDYSKDILLFLLFGKDKYKDYKDCSVESVTIKREKNYVDVFAEITLSNKEKYALFIELKYYSHTSDRQLQSYKNIDLEKEDPEYKDFCKKYVLLGVWQDEKPAEDEELAKNYGFTIVTFQDIVDIVFGGKNANSKEKLFDEFWTGLW